MKLTKTTILKIPHNHAIGFDGIRAFSVSGVSIDSRSIRVGELFVAIRGEQFDGHNFISKAVESGAAAIVVNRHWAESNAAMMVSITIPRIVVEDTTLALGALANMYRKKFDIPILVVGGSNGKTTTKEMIRSVLSAKYSVLCTEGNLNNHIGVPETLFRLNKKHTMAVVEVGTNHPGEIEYLCSMVEPTCGILTNIGREHLEFFGSLDGVAKAETEMFTWLAQYHGVIFVNGDDEYLSAASKKMKKRILYGFGVRNAAVKASSLSIDDLGCAAFQIKHQRARAFKVSVGVPGEHNAKNALAAATVGVHFKVAPEQIQHALKIFQAANKRMQVVRVGEITIINDTYNSNPDSVVAAFKTLKSLQLPGRRIAVLGDMLELGESAETLHRQIGKATGKYQVDILLTYGKLSHATYEAATTPTKSHFELKPVLIKFLTEIIAPGDIVLIKGSRGMKMEEVVASLSDHVTQKATA
ncbi:MAG TPA: UDP-N-acetylmuramoyl-tripeptide--D-alanyl-D-alanine ligase [Bacteroidota bacterium]|nr:UDP-N-acetylmuramoyl-tripeptide--D-alanyl-D-alanine ligase [Bacteroidota bacterium]